MKTGVERNKVIEDIVEMFNIGTNKSFCTGMSFMIHKEDFWRMEVIEKLQVYFSYKFIIGGQLIISPITLVYTTFEITDL